ncbi:hypothetical protein GCM10009430_24360 [Aquimarina litoralis]|uniref:YARHG domain-containing protein n=1 Tax=Aquimarina litoralis TaxID=584605 RepID=A0ABN1IVR7_9FLAO
MIRTLFAILLSSIIINTSLNAQINPYEFDKAWDAIETIDDIPPYLSIGDLWLLRNYIFAKKQYRFKNTGLDEFYGMHYDLVGIYNDVSDQFTDREITIINELKHREELLRKEQTWDVIGDHHFELRNGKLIVDGDRIYPIDHKKATYINTRQLGPTLYSIEIVSNYRVDIIGCCNEIGVTNDMLKQFFFDMTTNTVREIPDVITINKTIDQVIDNSYIFVLNNIFSGAHTLEIYDFKNFRFINKLEEIESIIYVDPDYMEIWCLTDREAELPYKYRRKFKFIRGTLTDTGIEEKVEVPWYFLG